MPRVPDHLTGINLGTSAALNAVLAAVKPASAMSDIFAQLNLANGGLSANYASQLSQMLSQRDALAGVVASSAASDVIARSGLGVHSAFVTAQAAQIVNAQDSIARLMVTTSMSASKDSLRDTLSRYGQVQTHLGAFALDVDAPVLLRGYTRLAGRRYDAYLDGLPARPIHRRAAVARFGAEAQTGLVVAEALTSDVDDDEREDLTARFDVVGVERGRAARQLLIRISWVPYTSSIPACRAGSRRPGRTSSVTGTRPPRSSPTRPSSASIAR